MTVSFVSFTRLDQFTLRFGFDLIVGELLIDVQCAGGRSSIPNGAALQTWGHQETGYSVARSRSVVFSLRNLARDPESIEQRERVAGRQASFVVGLTWRHIYELHHALPILVRQPWWSKTNVYDAQIILRYAASRRIKRYLVRTLQICLLLMYVWHAALPVKPRTLYMGRKQCLIEPCALCRTRSLHQELLALRLQKDTKQEVGERLAEDQDTLFRRVRHLTLSNHLHRIPQWQLPSCCCPLLGSAVSLFSSCRLTNVKRESGLTLMQAEGRIVCPLRMSGMRWSS